MKKLEKPWKSLSPGVGFEPTTKRPLNPDPYCEVVVNLEEQSNWLGSGLLL